MAGACKPQSCNHRWSGNSGEVQISKHFFPLIDQKHLQQTVDDNFENLLNELKWLHFLQLIPNEMLEKIIKKTA